MRFLRFFLLAATSLVSACEPVVHSQVQSFTELTAIPQSTTIAILPPKGDFSSMEMRAAESKIAPFLIKAGYSITDINSRPQQILYFEYGVDNGRDVVSHVEMPIYGQTGTSGSITTGTINTFGSTSTINTTTTSIPNYGIVGTETSTFIKTVYKRYLNLSIFDVQKSTKDKAYEIYRGKITSEGKCGNMFSIMDALLDGIFQKFPGPPVRSESVIVLNSARC